jgi:hypothetical protein
MFVFISGPNCRNISSNVTIVEAIFKKKLLVIMKNLEPVIPAGEELIC